MRIRNSEEEKAVVEGLLARRARGEKLTDRELLIIGHSQFGWGNPMGSGGCAPHVGASEVTELLEPWGEN